jgi:protein TonB
MASRIKSNIALLATVAALSACGTLASQPTAPAAQPEPTADNALAPETQSAQCNRNGSIATIDTYKVGVARHILRSNFGHTFDGHLPPMLPAIVVMRLSVDSAGAVTDVFVQRSRDDVASQVAMASIRRSGTFPLPCDLLVRPDGTLTFSETFLFNSLYQFQLRSLADPQ